jgi:hypothetical protein
LIPPLADLTSLRAFVRCSKWRINFGENASIIIKIGSKFEPSFIFIKFLLACLSVPVFFFNFYFFFSQKSNMAHSMCGTGFRLHVNAGDDIMASGGGEE